MLVTTSREPSSRLTAFAKELKLVFPNAQRVNRGGQARATLPTAQAFTEHAPCAPSRGQSQPAATATAPNAESVPRASAAAQPRLAASAADTASPALIRKRSQHAFLFMECSFSLQVIGDLVESCRSSGYTDIVVVHEHRGEPDGLVVCHLPFGTSSLPSPSAASLDT